MHLPVFLVCKTKKTFLVKRKWKRTIPFFRNSYWKDKSIQYRKKIILVDCKNHDTHDELDLSKSGKYTTIKIGKIRK